MENILVCPKCKNEIIDISYDGWDEQGDTAIAFLNCQCLNCYTRFYVNKVFFFHSYEDYEITEEIETE